MTEDPDRNRLFVHHLFLDGWMDGFHACLLAMDTRIAGEQDGTKIHNSHTTVQMGKDFI